MEPLAYVQTWYRSNNTMTGVCILESVCANKLVEKVWRLVSMVEMKRIRKSTATYRRLANSS